MRTLIARRAAREGLEGMDGCMDERKEGRKEDGAKKVITGRY